MKENFHVRELAHRLSMTVDELLHLLYTDWIELTRKPRKHYRYWPIDEVRVSQSAALAFCVRRGLSERRVQR